jgi:arylsulfatase A-like enzyme
MAGRPPNLLFIWTDEQRPDTLGAYGNRRIRTPHLDRLAGQGVVFEQAYCTQPVCSPSRASVLTGLYPHAHGVLQNNVPLPAGVPTLAERLRPAGYACGYVGKWHLGPELARRPEQRRGFDECWVSTEDMYTPDYGAEGYSDYHHFLLAQGYEPPDRVRDGRVFSRETAARLPEAVGKPAFQAEACLRFLETHRDRPFFLAVNFLEPHFPFSGPLDGAYDPAAMVLPETWSLEPDEAMPRHYRLLRQKYLHQNPHVRTNDRQGWQELLARYWGLCTLVDRHAGRILRRLEELGLAQDTVVVYTSDHGDLMGEHRLVGKCVQFEGAARVPLLVKAPGVAPGRVATPVSQVHLTPTLLDLLGLAVPGGLQGTSLRPLLTRGDLPPDGRGARPVGQPFGGAWDVPPDEAEVVLEWNGWNLFSAQQWQRDFGADPAQMAQPRSPVDARTIRRGRWKLSVYVTGEVELYDLRADPGEARNLARTAEQRATVVALYERLLAWQRETGDTLALPDPAPPPA